MLVTGSSRGIGAATVKAFSNEGARVVVHYHERKAAAEKVRKDCGEDTLLVQGDLTKEEEVERVVSQVVDELGRIDVLVNNAGAILWPGDCQGDLKT